AAGPKSSAAMRQARPTTTSTRELRPRAISRAPIPKRWRMRDRSISSSSRRWTPCTRACRAAAASSIRRSAWAAFLAKSTRIPLPSLVLLVVAPRWREREGRPWWTAAPRPRLARASADLERLADAEDERVVRPTQTREVLVTQHPGDGQVEVGDGEAV